MGGVKSSMDKGVKRTPASHSLLLSKAGEGEQMQPCGSETQGRYVLLEVTYFNLLISVFFAYHNR